MIIIRRKMLIEKQNFIKLLSIYSTGPRRRTNFINIILFFYNSFHYTYKQHHHLLYIKKYQKLHSIINNKSLPNFETFSLHDHTLTLYSLYITIKPPLIIQTTYSFLLWYYILFLFFFPFYFIFFTFYFILFFYFNTSNYTTPHTYMGREYTHST